jgi:predicted nicotinamide N-methyase
MTDYNKDIIPGVYEGGFKLWECTLDMLKYIEAQANIFEGKRIIEMGCGHGLLGILASKMGAK